MKVKQHVVINLPPEEIFAYMANLDNLVDWSSVTIAVRKISPGMIQTGATVRSTLRFLGKWLDMTFEIVEAEPSHCLTLKSVSGGTPCLFSYQYDPVESGRTNVSLEAMIHFTGIVGLTESVVTRVIRRQLKHDLLTLKDMLEADASSSHNTR